MSDSACFQQPKIQRARRAGSARPQHPPHTRSEAAEKFIERNLAECPVNFPSPLPPRTKLLSTGIFGCYTPQVFNGRSNLASPGTISGSQILPYTSFDPWGSRLCLPICVSNFLPCVLDFAQNKQSSRCWFASCLPALRRAFPLRQRLRRPQLWRQPQAGRR